MSSEKTETRFPVTSEEVSRLPLRERIGVSINAKDAVQGLKRVTEAEEAGVRQVWMTSMAVGATDTLSFCALAARQTREIRLGTSIMQIYSRHPVTAAQQALLAHDAAPGRLRLGIGTSHQHINEGQYGVSMREPLAYLTEYITVLRSILWQGHVEFEGRFFKTKYSAPRVAHVPILVAALGTKAYRIAGQISDGVISWMCPPSYLIRKAIPALKEGARVGNRPVPPVVAQISVAFSEDKEAVYKAANASIGRYPKLPFYSHMMDEAGLPAGDEERRFRALVDSMVISGNEDTVKEGLLNLIRQGLDELLVMLVPVSDEENERKILYELVGSL